MNRRRVWTPKVDNGCASPAAWCVDSNRLTDSNGEVVGNEPANEINEIKHSCEIELPRHLSVQMRISTFRSSHAWHMMFHFYCRWHCQSLTTCCWRCISRYASATEFFALIQSAEVYRPIGLTLYSQPQKHKIDKKYSRILQYRESWVLGVQF